jgi:hypothetical protein
MVFKLRNWVYYNSTLPLTGIGSIAIAEIQKLKTKMISISNAAVAQVCIACFLFQVYAVLCSRLL